MKVMFFLFYVFQGIWKFFFKNYKARNSSNIFLREVLPFLEGNIINVSGWNDSDKEGSYYRNYYKSVFNYTISNIEGSNGMPDDSQKDKSVNWEYINLNEPIKDSLKNKYDVVFNHTVLEHIFDTNTALKNLIDLTKDILVIVVPFSQDVHYTKSYSDYVRFTPYYFKKYFELNCMELIYCKSNDNPYNSIYITIVGSKSPSFHKDILGLNKIHMDVQILPSRFGKYGMSGRNAE